MRTLQSRTVRIACLHLTAASAAVVLAAGLSTPASADPTAECNKGVPGASTECGINATAGDAGATAVGASASADGAEEMAVGVGSSAALAAAVADGAGSAASGEGATAIWAANTAVYGGEMALSASFSHRLDTRKPFAVSGAVAFGGRETGVRVGVAGEF